MNLQGKTAVVTGALQGIGKSTVEVFARNGANVIACAYQETEAFKQFTAELSERHGVVVLPVYCDMTDNDSLKAAVSAIQKTKLPIDALINIAGIARDALFHMVTGEQMRSILHMNFEAQMVFTQYITKLMLRRHSGSVVFTSSVTAMDGNIGQLVYGASKAALLSAMKTLSRELGPQGIRVNAIAPGVILSPMTEGLLEQELKSKIVKSDLGRIGQPEEVANVAMFLASDDAAYITGQVIRVDGGIG